MEKSPNLEKQSQRKSSNLRSTDFRLFLQEEFLKRLKLNPRYSLRAFAQFFSMNPGSLSQFLKGQRNLSDKMITKMSQKMNLEPQKVQIFISENQKNQARKSSLEAQKNFKLEQLTMDSFAIISDWYHFAILELPFIKGFKNDPHWIAGKLGLHVQEVSAAMERLVRVGMLTIHESGHWEVKDQKRSTLDQNYTTAALRKFQKQILEKAIQALETLPMEQRSQSSLTFGLADDEIENVKNMIHRFRRELNAYVESRKNRDKVYHVSLSLYPVSFDHKS